MGASPAGASVAKSDCSPLEVRCVAASECDQWIVDLSQELRKEGAAAKVD